VNYYVQYLTIKYIFPSGFIETSQVSSPSTEPIYYVFKAETTTCDAAVFSLSPYHLRLSYWWEFERTRTGV